VRPIDGSRPTTIARLASPRRAATSPAGKDAAERDSAGFPFAIEIACPRVNVILWIEGDINRDMRFVFPSLTRDYY